MEQPSETELFARALIYRQAGDDDATGDEHAVGDGLPLQVGVGDAGVAAEEAALVRLHRLQLARKERDGG